MRCDVEDVLGAVDRPRRLHDDRRVHQCRDQLVNSPHRYLARAIAFISSRWPGRASAVTPTAVQAGKLPLM